MAAPSVRIANEKMAEGWKLLAVTTTSNSEGKTHPCYVLGKLNEIPAQVGLPSSLVGTAKMQD